MFWTVALAVPLLVYFAIKVWKAHNYWKEKGIPYHESVPLVGVGISLLQGKKFLAELLQDIYNAFPNDKYLGCHMFMQPLIVVRDPDIVKQISVGDFDYFSEHRQLAPDGIEPLLPRTLFASKAGRWRELRPVLSPAFTGSKMRVMFSIMEDCARRYVDFFLKNNPESLDVELKDIFSRYSNDIIATTAFGVECDSLTHPDNEFYRMGRAIGDISGLNAVRLFFIQLFPTIMKALKFSIFPAKPLKYFSDVMKETIDQRENHGVVRQDLMQLMLEARRGSKHVEVTHDDIIAQPLMFFLGGFDTISTAMSFTVYHLALHQEIQEKLRDEIDEIWKNEDGKLSFDALSQMKYMDMVISESLRMYPPMFLIDRKCVRPYTFEPAAPDKQPLKVEPEQVLFIPAYAIHRDEKYYPEPERFDPERFSEENKPKIHPGSYIPFGIGPRNCMGMRFSMIEMKTFIFHLLRNFEVTPNKHSQIPLVLKKKALTMNVEKGFHVSLNKRRV